MISQYQNTQQGQQTRSQLVKCFDANNEFSRDDLVTLSGLSYEQVRRQTKNLCIEGVIKSRISTNGKRIYQLRSSFIGKMGISAVCLFLACSIQIGTKFKSHKVYAFVPLVSSIG